jgi:uncharacterized protein (DUF362 family)
MEDISKTVIKPNLCNYGHSSTGLTTDPEVVAAIIDYIRQKNESSNITIVESDATATRADFAFKSLGYETLAKEKQVELVNLSNEKTVTINLNGLFFKKFRLPKIMADADFFVSVPKLRTHEFFLIRISCALKNQFGCNPIQKKSRFHPQLSNVITDLNNVMKPDLFVVDGIYARSFIPSKLNLIMAGNDPVAIDCIAAKIMGFNPQKVDHIVCAAKNGLGNMDRIKLVGEDPNVFEKLFPSFGFNNIIKAFILKMGTKLSRIF